MNLEDINEKIKERQKEIEDCRVKLQSSMLLENSSEEYSKVVSDLEKAIDSLTDLINKIQ
jgi:hypothetical protein